MSTLIVCINVSTIITFVVQTVSQIKKLFKLKRSSNFIDIFDYIQIENNNYISKNSTCLSQKHQCWKRWADLFSPQNFNSIITLINTDECSIRWLTEK